MVCKFLQKGNVKMQNSAKFFRNTDCQYFPCHQGLDEGCFNCLFCYCPLYSKNPCPGNATYIKKEDGRLIKRCTDCIFPHKAENYEKIMKLLRVKKEAGLGEEYHHGGENETKACSLDFSVNVNPLGLPESVKSAVKNSLDSCEKYPDQNCRRLRKKIALKIQHEFGLGVQDEQIVCGNGASELISLAVNAISPKDALLIAPTFYGYERALKICDCRLHYHFLDEGQDFDLDETIFDSIEKVSPDMVLLCNPNNPTGRMVNPGLFEKILRACEEKDIFLLVDECFIDFTERAGESALRFIEGSPHLIVLNAFTKIFAMAGLRLGYIISANAGLIQKINSLRPEWNVSTLAQVAGEAALAEADYIRETRVLIGAERLFLLKELKALGLKVYPTEANFILFAVEAPELAEKLESYLRENGIFLRKCGNFIGLDGRFFRVAVRTHQENIRLIEKIREFFFKDS